MQREVTGFRRLREQVLGARTVARGRSGVENFVRFNERKTKELIRRIRARVFAMM